MGIKVSGSEVVMWGLPLPPSDNNLYETRRIRGKSRRIPSEGLQEFQAAMQAWHFQHCRGLLDAGATIRRWSSRPQLEVVVGFKHSRLLTKDGRPQKLDASNRVKALQDAIAKAIGIDDSALWATTVHKASIMPHDPFAEGAIAVLRPHEGLWFRQWMDRLVSG